MTQHETISRDSRSYRHGLVLGLTLAEVMLLLVFTLLITMAAIWKFEREERRKLEIAAKPSTSINSEILAALTSVKDQDNRKVAAAIKAITSGQELEPLNKQEKVFVDETRKQFASQSGRIIDDNWRALTNALKQSGDLQKRLDLAESTMKASQAKGRHDWPPIIRLREAEGYYFAKGSAELPDQFQQKLDKDVVPQLLKIAEEFDVDVIEVLGHTDEQAILQRFSNLDKQLLETTKGASAINTLLPADNAGLGLARAVSVVRALELDPRLQKFKLRILPLSGGQLIDTNDTIAQGVGGDVKERRRIEIRLRRSQN